LFRQIFDGD